MCDDVMTVHDNSMCLGCQKVVKCMQVPATVKFVV